MHMLQIIKKGYLNDCDVAEWKLLWDTVKSATFFNSYNWYNACVHSMFPNIIVWFVYQDDRLIAVLPLEPMRSWLIPCLMTYGQPYSSKSTILIREDYTAMLPQILKQLGESKLVVLNEIEESQCSDFISYVLHETASVSPYVNLKQDIYQQVKKQEWNYISKKAYKSDYQFIVYHAENAYQRVNTIWEIEQRSNKPKRSRNIFTTKAVKDFYRQISATPEATLAVLQDGDKAIACLFGFYVKGNNFLVDYMSYDEAYKRNTPGKLVIVLLLRYLMEHGCVKFDFSRGETIIKKHYSTYRENNYTLFCNVRKWQLNWLKLCLWLKHCYYYQRRFLKKIGINIKFLNKILKQ